MSNEVEDFQNLQRRVERLRKARDEAAGALGEVMKRLDKEFGCKTLDQAVKKLAALRRQKGQAAEEYRRERDKFLKDFGDLLDGREA